MEYLLYDNMEEYNEVDNLGIHSTNRNRDLPKKKWGVTLLLSLAKCC